MTDLPRYLADAKAHREPSPARPVNGTRAPGEATAYATAAFRDELDTLARQTEPGRNDQLNRSAYNLAQLVGAGHLPHDDTWYALDTTARAIGLTQAETSATLRSAFRAGLEQPRDVADYGTDEPPPVTVVDYADPPPTDDDPPPPTIRERFPALDWQRLWADDTEEEWVIEPILPARRLVALYSPPKVGKSLLLLELAVAIATGEPALGTTLDRPRRVLYVDFENDPRGDVRTRLQAMGRKPEELDRLVYLSFPRLAFLDTYIGGLELLAIVEEYDVEVVVIDTVSRAVGGEENDNDTWLGFYKHTGLALKARGIATIRLDHTGKDPTKGMRGGSAKYGDVDAVWSMTRVTDDTLRLDCTANRLPITEKTLVLTRELLPYLHHRVNPEGKSAAMSARIRELVDALDVIYGDQPCPSIKDAAKQLRARGNGARFDLVREALGVWDLKYNRIRTEEDSP